MDKQKNLVSGIVAIGSNSVIGFDGGLPWYSTQDLFHFRTVTMGHPCIFGRATYEALPRKPLDGRLNLVCSSQYNNEYIDGVFYAQSLESALAQCSGAEPFICGGAQMYEYALDNDLIDVMHLTRIYDTGLSERIKSAPWRYKSFPYGLRTFFDFKKWWPIEKFYDPGTLPVERGNVHARFYTCFRIR